MKTTREERAAIVSDVNANLAVDNLISDKETLMLQEVYISGKYTITEIIEKAKIDLKNKLDARNNHDVSNQECGHDNK